MLPYCYREYVCGGILIGFYETESTTRKTLIFLISLLTDVMDKAMIDHQMLLDILSGVQAHVKPEDRRAVYVHCLALSGTRCVSKCYYV